jgi:hypothetical protein
MPHLSSEKRLAVIVRVALGAGVPLVTAGALAVGCFSSSSASPTPNGAEPGSDAGDDAQSTSDDGTPSDAGTPPDATLNADTGVTGAADAAVDASDAQAVVLGAAGHLYAFGGSGAGEARVYTFAAGTWTTEILLSSRILIDQTTSTFEGNVPGGGGLGVLTGGARFGTFLDYFNGQAMATAAPASGTWSSLSDEPDAATNLLMSQPVSSGNSAFVARELPSGAIFVDELTGTTTWTTAATGVTGDRTSLPVVAITSAGDPLVVSFSSGSYQWSLRTAGTWSAPAAIAGLSGPPPGNGMILYMPSVASVQLPATGDLLFGFTSSEPADGSTAVDLKVATFSNGAWSAATAVANDLALEPTESAHFAALPDGTIAMAYVATVAAGGSPLQVGFYDGTTWSAFRGATGVYTSDLFDICRGAAGAALEVVYSDANNNFYHGRLTDRANWVWQAGISIDVMTMSRGFNMVQALAAP